MSHPLFSDIRKKEKKKTDKTLVDRVYILYLNAKYLSSFIINISSCQLVAVACLPSVFQKQYGDLDNTRIPSYFISAYYFLSQNFRSRKHPGNFKPAHSYSLLVGLVGSPCQASEENMQLPHITDSQMLPHGGSDVLYGWCEAYGDGKLVFYKDSVKSTH